MLSLRIYLTWALTIFLFHTCVAQFNDSTNYFINLSSTGIINKTNDRSSWILNNSFRFAIYKKHISLNSSVGFIYGEQQHVLTNRDFTAAFDFNRYVKRNEDLYFWGLAVYDKNFSLKIENRLQSGLGVGYSILNKPNSIITLSNGVLYERSNLIQSSEVPAVDYETYRNSFRLKFRFVLKERFTGEGSDFLQHALDNRKDYIIRSQTNLSFKLIRSLSFTTALNYNKMSATGRENLLVNFGLTVERYF